MAEMHGNGLRYTGTLKFYNPKQALGYIIVDPGYPPVEGIVIPPEVRCGPTDFITGGGAPQRMEGVAVEYGICRVAPNVDSLKACAVTLPGGLPLTLEALENRQMIPGQTYLGEVVRWNDVQGWGFIRLEPCIQLPPFLQAKLAQQAQAASERSQGVQEELVYLRRTDVQEGVQIDRGSQIMFRIYADDKGVGACRVEVV
eukprot:TRINITY_DN21062_c0_g1_i1.p1 TRINITY_DN21062_c0_g1~~TRINITY_DN21062_c0_g1_i1.p1  ORF type:complete len:200 (+),score=37.16 TRINITY_DN21062_c0_g1_i1:106-705(+)